ncbi:MAG TPA: bifunctional UDP-N-acetylglucosamine diphosphorylase/glucosamine-1-phosphate N-acetyltransferase GlmU [Gaiellales bacterium]|jgi:bifunctional UDP-N-acetylglucosamine pyrophosphorylase/glucosamine-1-phosphate N-acetyltransferase|nr:bifunctional UDP-N-acetylglucosamine diphosphorylase/glucosamine-1-phosphate N-acetyltransferase GlmU [Gaiellales bacterium]
MAAITTIIMAGGLGTRMRSPLPKVLHELCGLPMLAWVERAAREAGAEDVVIVAGPETAEQIAAALPDCRVVVQSPANGTGDAVRVGMQAVPAEAERVVVLSGDTPLIEAETVRRAIAACADGIGGALVSARLAPPHAYGRVVRDGDRVARIVEARDATPEELALDEFNVGLYCFQRAALAAALRRLSPQNAQGELYLTDVIALLAEGGAAAVAVDEPAPETGEGVNTLAELAEREAGLRARILRDHMLAGVRIVDPATTYVDGGVRLEAGSRLEPHVILRGATTVGAGSVLGPYAMVDDGTIGQSCRVGPFAYLRPGCTLADGAQVGRFVELKNTSLGERAKVPHLSYLGDTDVGAGSNLGASTITANYDGQRKHRTTIGEGVSTMVHSTLVAPVTIGDGAYVAAGSVITDDVEPGALAIARPRQTTKPGYAARVAARRKEGEH